MLENRNCMGHEVNDETRDGDNDVGIGKTGSASTSVIVRPGCYGERDARRMVLPARMNSLNTLLSGEFRMVMSIV